MAEEQLNLPVDVIDDIRTAADIFCKHAIEIKTYKDAKGRMHLGVYVGDQELVSYLVCPNGNGWIDAKRLLSAVDPELASIERMDMFAVLAAGFGSE